MEKIKLFDEKGIEIENHQYILDSTTARTKVHTMLLLYENEILSIEEALASAYLQGKYDCEN